MSSEILSGDPSHVPATRPAFSILYATTATGLRLPVVDVTHPAFAAQATEAELQSLSEQFVRDSIARGKMGVLQRLFLRFAMRRSLVGRGLVAASGGNVLDGMTTYMLKLGPENLGAAGDPIGRRIAASFPAVTARLRLHDMARLLADGLAPKLARDDGRPVCLVNIAGGPAADSLNALLLLRSEHSEHLATRHAVVAVFDLDDRGPAFGARSLDALVSPEAPLEGLAISFRHVGYNWTQPARLREMLDELKARDSVCAISSEGGLFEYGSDDEIAPNLEALRSGTPADAVLVGSVTRDDEPTRVSRAASGIPTRPRTIEAFQALIERVGWKLDRVIARPFTYNVRALKA